MAPPFLRVPGRTRAPLGMMALMVATSPEAPAIFSMSWTRLRRPSTARSMVVRSLRGSFASADAFLAFYPPATAPWALAHLGGGGGLPMAVRTSLCLHPVMRFTSSSSYWRRASRVASYLAISPWAAAIWSRQNCCARSAEVRTLRVTWEWVTGGRAVGLGGCGCATVLAGGTGG